MKRNGFTLIELLAVIIILGIISLIAIPAISKIIKQSKKSAFEVSINNLSDAIKYTCQLQMLEREQITKKYIFTETGVSPSLDVKGILPIAGTATVDDNCNIFLSVTNGKFTATKKSTEDSVTVLDGDKVKEPPITYVVYPNGTAVYFNPETGSKCTIGEAVSTTGTKSGCMKWYTFDDGGDSAEKINLILDHNTTAEVEWNSTGSNESGPEETLTQLASDTSSWAGVPTRSDSYSVSNSTTNGSTTYTITYSTYKARLIKASEIAAITGNSSFVEETSTSANWFYLDSNNKTQTATTTGTSNFAWLFDYTNSCTGYGCNISDTSNYGYWTSTAVSGEPDIAWKVTSIGRLDFSYVDSLVGGVRPVITISKLVIQ